MRTGAASPKVRARAYEVVLTDTTKRFALTFGTRRATAQRPSDWGHDDWQAKREMDGIVRTCRERTRR